MEKLIALCSKKYDSTTWHEESREAFEEIFETRYPKTAKNAIQFRTPKMNDENIAFSAIIHISNPKSGGYSGMSFVIFPVPDAPPMIALGIGTQGLSPDDNILGKPGHSRKTKAISKWLNLEFGNGRVISWAKQDPTRNDIDIPEAIKSEFEAYEDVFKRYGEEIYAFTVGFDNVLKAALCTYLDLFVEERGFSLKSDYTADANGIKDSYFSYIFKNYTTDDIFKLLNNRKYVIIQGPPGTGKTRLGIKILKEKYRQLGFNIQFHSNTTYENFVGGLFPTIGDGAIGFTFKEKAGDFIKAIQQATVTREKYLLVIDEINRADLSKVLGEAIFCLEPFEEEREITLPYAFEELNGNILRMPPNLHILGLMNNSDRSISYIDVAIRRRFAFVDLWPDIEVIKSLGTEISLELYRDLLSIFIEFSNDEAFNLLPGHSYFLQFGDMSVEEYLKTNLVPLLKDYVQQGYVSSFSEQIHAYIQRVESL
jgi:5-methylcytosine-specific restriction protein B